MKNIKVIIFDWGDTLMRDFPEFEGSMAEWQEIEVIEGVQNLLKKLHKKYRIVVASNANDSDAELMKKAFERGEIAKFIDKFYTSKEIGYKKPEKEFFEEIFKMEKILPKESLFVGNIYENDVEPAIKSGANGILFDEKKKYCNINNKIEKMEELWKKLQENFY